MPELAEVEYVRKVTAQHALHKTITNVTVFEDEIVFVNKTATEIKSALINSTVTKVCRKGKIFWIELDKPPHISFHLGMTGRMMIKGQNILTYYRYPDKNIQNTWPPRFAKLVIVFNDDTEIAFTNTRRFGRVRLHKHLPGTEQPISNLGYDPFSAMCSLDEFTPRILKRKCPLKAALLDQSFTAGVGNWIADEVCYQSGVYPGIYCHKLNILQIKRIYESLQSITKYAVSVDANYTQFPCNWLFHYRWNKGKKRKNKNDNAPNEYHMDCFGNDIIFEQIGGRTTAIVFKLQSKHNGYRIFNNSKQLGKIETFTEKLKMSKRYTNELMYHQNKNTNSHQNKKRKIKNKDKSEPPQKKRKVTQRKGKMHNPKTHVLTSNNVLVPIQLLRRSSRLASKRSNSSAE